MPMNRVSCSMTRLLCLRLHARPSGATLDHAHGETGHPFRAATDHRWKGAQVDIANTDRLVPRAPPLAGPGQSPGLTSFPDSPGPETDMRSSAPDLPSVREPKTYASRNKPHRFACSLYASPVTLPADHSMGAGHPAVPYLADL